MTTQYTVEDAHHVIVTIETQEARAYLLAAINSDATKQWTRIYATINEHKTRTCIALFYKGYVIWEHPNRCARCAAAQGNVA